MTSIFFSLIVFSFCILGFPGIVCMTEVVGHVSGHDHHISVVLAVGTILNVYPKQLTAHIAI